MGSVEPAVHPGYVSISDGHLFPFCLHLFPFSPSSSAADSAL